MLETIAENLLAAIVLTLGIPALGYVIKNCISWKFKERELKLLNISKKEELELLNISKKEELELLNISKKEELAFKREDFPFNALFQEPLRRNEELVILMRDETEDMGVRICAYYEYCYLQFNGPTLKCFRKILYALKDIAPVTAAQEIMKGEYPILFSKYKDAVKGLPAPA